LETQVLDLDVTVSVADRNRKLREVLKFSDADLLLNQQEKVSESQKLGLNSFRQGRMISLIAFGVMFVVFTLVCVGIGISILVSPDGSVTRLAILLAMGFVMLLIAASAVNFFLRSRDVLTGKVSQMQGSAKLYTHQYRDEYRSLGMGWFVKIDRKEFRLSTAEQYGALEEGATYRIFYVKGYPLDVILSVEAI
jgi:hypothetical protein